MTEQKDSHAQDANARGPLIDVVAALAAAVSLLEHTPRAKKAAASDKMFDQMLTDYRAALERGRAALRSPAASDKPAWRDAMQSVVWWLEGCLKCKEWHWDGLQREAAEEAVKAANAVMAARGGTDGAA